MIDRCEPRDGLTVRLLAVHTTEGNGTAQQLRDADWWEGSSHAINDEHGTLLTPAEGCVPYGMAAWTLRSGNRISENIEQVGWARWTRPEWLARPKLLDNTARWLAARSKARGIPLVKLTPAEVAAGKWGVIGHVDWTVGMRDGTHTDPGPNYPWDVVLDKARAYANGTAQEDELTPDQDAKLDRIHLELTQMLKSRATPGATYRDTVAGYVLNADGAAWRIEQKLGGMASAVNALTKLVAEQNGLSLDDVRRVISEEIAKGVDVDVTVQPGTPAA